LLDYGYYDLAGKIKTNWTSTIERVFKKAGRITEKYNVVDTSLVAGGGEYLNQDGFGWTNGVYLKLKSYG
jgi:alpha,alpha-trehalase